MQSIGIPEQRIVRTMHAVDNSWWASRAADADYREMRMSWNIPEQDIVILFCGKLQPWKRPDDALHAFMRAQLAHTWLVFAGDGAMREQLELLASDLGVAQRVRFLGFQNQSQLPAVYNASNVLVLPSDYEAFGLVVNEAMACGCPAIISDRVGAKYDLVQHNVTGFVYPCGDIDMLVQVLVDILSDNDRLMRMSELARKHVQKWSPEANANALVSGVERILTQAGNQNAQ
jgi:glycosyltransferase involved in cell wall biosynthesis